MEKHTEMIHKRKYNNYADYEQHQISKLNKEFADIKNKSGNRKTRIQNSLKALLPYLPEKEMQILCLGARMGEEVEVFHEAGYENAVGIDLNPSSKYVLKGDFHDLRKHDCNFGNDSIDLIYCNSFDHAFDLQKMANEINRVLNPSGFIIADFGKGVTGKPSHVTKKNWEALTWDYHQDVLALFEPYKVLTKNDGESYTTVLIQLDNIDISKLK